MNKFFKIFSIVAAIAFLAAAFFVWCNVQVQKSQIGEVEMTPAPESPEKNQAVQVPDNQADSPTQKSEPALPAGILINVPFTSQAPTGVWDAYHEEACEEASIIIIKYYLDKKALNPGVAEEQIQKMIAFEIKNYGNYEDTDAQKNVKLASDFYGIKNLKVVYNFQKDDLKRYLSLGKPIIVPAAGRMLGNSNFTQPGPLYHNLVLIGYEGDTIITNDPGTRKGRGYRYNIEVLYNAIHDFPGDKNNIVRGRKAMIVLE